MGIQYTVVVPAKSYDLNLYGLITCAFNIDPVRSNGTVPTENAAMRSNLRGLAPRAAEDLVALLRGWVL